MSFQLLKIINLLFQLEYQGEREMAADNVLGNFELVGIPPAPRGTPKLKLRLILMQMVSLVFHKDKGTEVNKKFKHLWII